jgi:MFS family permease
VPVTRPAVAAHAPRRATLTLASLAVAFAAADTYVVVLALPDMMRGVGLNIDQLQRAAPIVSGFLLGYVAMLPLIGRVADLRGRVPVLVFSLVVFAFGSLLTATAHDLFPMVLGRFLQGLGGGGLVPTTLALVADLWPAERRGLPLGVVGAVQELGAVLGPLYGALVLVLWPWPAIFWINLLVGIALAAAIAAVGRRTAPDGRVARSGCVDRPQDNHFAPSDARGGRDWLGLGTLAVAAAALALLLAAPEPLVRDVTLGLAWVPVAGDTGWLTPLALLTLVALAVFVVRDLIATRPLLNLRALGQIVHRTDMLGAGLLGLSLAGIVLAFATADPQVAVLSPRGPWYLAASALAAAGFWWRQRRAAHPLVPRRALAAPAAWGSLAVSFFVGAALIAALVDVPVFARVTTHPAPSSAPPWSCCGSWSRCRRVRSPAAGSYAGSRRGRSPRSAWWAAPARSPR